MKQMPFCGFLPEERVTAQVREAFAVLADQGVPFWRHGLLDPGAQLGSTLMPGIQPDGTRGYFWFIFGEAPLEVRLQEAALEKACRLLAACVPLIPEAVLSGPSASYDAADFQWLKERLLSDARKEVPRG